jgi:antitoxin HicB
MKYHFKIYKEKTGFWAECVELEGCRSQGNTRDELLKNLSEALELFLAEPSDSSALFSLPRSRKPKGRDIVAIGVDPHVAFAFLLRQTRLRSHLSIREAAKKLHLTHHAAYQNLENARKANPELSTLAKLKEAFPNFPFELVFDKAS